MDEGQQEAAERGTAARIGVSMLNLLLPGGGLLRVGRARPGIGFLIAPFAWILLLTASALLLPTLSSAGFLVVILLSSAASLVLYVGSIAGTWRHSRFRTASPRWWQLWYSLAALMLVYQVALSFTVDLMHGFYKPYFIPAESMAPTFGKGDRLVADMRGGGPPRPGEVILLRVADHIYVKRVAAVAGDRIAMVGGVPVVNGKPAVQRKAGSTTLPPSLGGRKADIFVERLPGETGEHRILETYPTAVDDMDEVKVPAGHLFVLGDNRDFSADSRVPREEQGVEMVPVEDVRGRALFRTWDRDWRWLGKAVR